MKRTLCLLVSLLSVTVLNGCAAQKSYISHPDFTNQMNSPATIGVVIGMAKCYRIDSAGKATIDEEKTRSMRTCVEEGALKAFSENGYEAKIVGMDKDIKKIVQTYSSVHRNIRNQFPGGEESVSNPVNFGNLSPLMDRSGIDVLAVIVAYDEESTAGRTAAKLGLSIISSYQPDVGFATIALIDRDGRILYFDSPAGVNYNLTDKESAEKLLGRIVEIITHAKKQS